MNDTSTNQYTLLPFDVIVDAVNGDADAINRVLKRYRGYITVLSTRYLYDEAGNKYIFVDEEKRQMLEIQLITKILYFQTDQIF